MNYSDNKNNVNSTLSTAERINEIEAECRLLDTRIEALTYQGEGDLEIASLKRQQFLLKEEIVRLKDKSLPDIIA
ncbi:DUF465 domain-containing protein [Hirschia litorea]|uniref:DUF465 domain-containing protein n=1 Tax=Hirschia litorea TaxID=1199156 RepID=A0ABW2IMY7_9PROT